MSPTPVFISYARADEHFATELMNRLAKEPDIAPWQDRIKMAPGDFEDQIRRGIDSSELFVLVFTPAALRSTWVEREWRYARESGRCIVPIKPTFDSQMIDAELDKLRAELPIWMQRIQTYDFDAYWKRFVAVLQSPCQATRAPFQAGDLPSNFVHRTAQFQQIVDAILDEGHKNPSGETVVVHGTGGFGKTTLALSVCHDPDVFMACDGGILWVTLGEQPSVASELEKIYAALTGERPGFKDQDEAMFEVAKKLEGKRCLIVIDDAWNTRDLKPFLHAARSCSRLVTTRVFNVARDAADERRRISIASPTADEAERMLSAGMTIPADSVADLRLLAERLKRVPLLLQLANRTLRGRTALGESVQDALDWALRQYIDYGAVAFDDKSGGTRNDAIRNTVEVSLGFLKDERQRCLELGVLHEDTDVPFSVIGTLWNANPTQVQQLVQRLHDFALVELNLPRQTIRLHDHIRAYLEGELAHPALVHARLAEAWKDPRRLPGGYAVQQIVFHLTESLDEPQQVVVRAQQFIALLTDARFSAHQRQHGDATALNRKLTMAIARAAKSAAPEAPGLIASLALLRQSYANESRDPERAFTAAAEGRVGEAVERLALLEADPHWETLARLLIAWLAPPEKAEEARDLIERTANSCDEPQLERMLAWVRLAPDGVPPDLPLRSGGPDISYISAIVQRAGGAEDLEGLEPLDLEGLASGNDSAGFIAERDGPDLVAFARLDPATNTQYLKRYIEIHAANRYVYYRNRSLWALLPPILEFPDAVWVRELVQRIVMAALTVARMDFEEFLPLVISVQRARDGAGDAATVVEETRQRLVDEIATLRATEGWMDSWSHYQRRATALAEVLAVALGRGNDAASMLDFARELPKGFAAFRAASALTLAESRLVAAGAAATALDNAALTSATAASHRIQDYRFCLQTTAIVNAVRARWSDMTTMDLEATVTRFLENPLSDDFCAVHRVLEQFDYRAHEYQTLAIPDSVRSARTLRQIADAFGYEPETLSDVNGWIWPGPNGAIDTLLEKDDAVNIPNRDFIPILAARFAAEALASKTLSAESRTRLIQQLVPLTLSNNTARDTVLGRLMLSTLDRAAALPAPLATLTLPDSASMASAT